MQLDPELNRHIGQSVEVTVTIRGILTGYFDKALVLDVENGPEHFLVMTKEQGFGVKIKLRDRDAKLH